MGDDDLYGQRRPGTVCDCGRTPAAPAFGSDA
jgi:hypothetical protein